MAARKHIAVRVSESAWAWLEAESERRTVIIRQASGDPSKRVGPLEVARTVLEERASVALPADE